MTSPIKPLFTGEQPTLAPHSSTKRPRSCRNLFSADTSSSTTKVSKKVLKGCKLSFDETSDSSSSHKLENKFSSFSLLADTSNSSSGTYSPKRTTNSYIPLGDALLPNFGNLFPSNVFNQPAPQRENRRNPPEVKKKRCLLGRNTEMARSEVVRTRRVGNNNIYTLSINGSEFEATRLGGGNYKFGYTINPQQNPVLTSEGAPGNQSIILTAFNDEKKEIHNLKLLNLWRKHAEAQRVLLETAGFKVPKVYYYDPKTTLSIVEKINNPCEPDAQHWANPNVQLEDLPAAVLARVQQIRAFIEGGVKYGTAIDANIDNFRYNDQNEVYLIDFKEEEEDGDEAFAHMHSAIQRLSRGNPHILKYLSAPLPSISEWYNLF